MNTIRKNQSLRNIGTENSSDESFDMLSSSKRQCERLNEETEKLPEICGFHCTECNDRGGTYKISESGEICFYCCTHCANVREGMYLLKKSGLADKTFEIFETNSEWQKRLLERVRKYSASDGKWLFIGGQSGCGKTHLCTAAAREIILGENVSAALFKWVEDARELKALVNDSSYSAEADKFRKADILYIDDLLKGSVTAADLKLGYDLVDYRYRHRLRTIISSEMFLSEIISKDEALGGRIKEMAGEFAFNIKRDRSKNYRLGDE